MKKILVIDDNSNIRMLVTTTLRANPDYHVMEADNGVAGLEIAGREIPDLILLDVRMPGMDGLQVCRLLKSSPTTSKIKIILLTGLEDDEDRQRGKEACADDYFTKPFRPTALLRKISEMLPD